MQFWYKLPMDMANVWWRCYHTLNSENISILKNVHFIYASFYNENSQFLACHSISWKKSLHNQLHFTKSIPEIPTCIEFCDEKKNDLIHIWFKFGLYENPHIDIAGKNSNIIKCWCKETNEKTQKSFSIDRINKYKN